MSITTTHYRFAVGAFLVYDICNVQSFINLRDWLHKIREFSDNDVVIGLVANKSDLVDEDDRKNCYGKYANQNRPASTFAGDNANHDFKNNNYST